MKPLPFLAVALLLLAQVRPSAAADGDLFDKFDDYLAVSAFHGYVRARVSGLLDLEAYSFTQPPPGLIDSTHYGLLNPRLTVFLDLHAGPYVYLFAQARLDRGFDPGDHGARLRLDEYALRISPWADSRLNLQLGKFATIIGNWVQRHDSWENPFINAPLPYENPIHLSARDASSSPADFFADAESAEQTGVASEYGQIPIIWGPDYTTGLSAFGALGKFDYAAEVKNASLSSPPEYWDATELGFDHPTVSARLGFRPDESWNLGISASEGSYLTPDAISTLPPSRGIGDYRELLLGQDLSFAWHHLQFWAECFETRFQVPALGNADTVAWYVEAKYKFFPQFFGAVRFNRQIFSTVPNAYDDGTERWNENLSTVDIAAAYRFTTFSQFKLQYTVGRTDGGVFSHLIAGQFTIRF